METEHENNKTKKSSERTFFGLEVVITRSGKVVRYSDIEKLPFFDFWSASHVGSGMMELTERQGIEGEVIEKGVYLHDWIAFSQRFIQTGKHRYSEK